MSSMIHWFGNTWTAPSILLRIFKKSFKMSTRQPHTNSTEKGIYQIKIHLYTIRYLAKIIPHITLFFQWQCDLEQCTGQRKRDKEYNEYHEILSFHFRVYARAAEGTWRVERRYRVGVSGRFNFYYEMKHFAVCKRVKFYLEFLL